MMSGVADQAAVSRDIGTSGGAFRDAEMTDDGWNSGDFDAAKILAYGGCRRIGDDVHEFDENEDGLDSF